MSLQRAALLIPLAIAVAAAPVGAQSKAKRAGELVDQLTKPELNHGQQQRIYAELLGLGPPARRELAERCGDLSPSQADWAITLLARLDPRLAMKPIRELCRSREIIARRSASAALQDLVETDPDFVFDVAQELLRDPDGAVTINAALVLSQVGTREVWSPLLALLVSELTHDPEVSLRPRRPTLIGQLVQTLAEMLESKGDHRMLVQLFQRAAQLKLESDDAVAGDQPALPYYRLFEILGHRPIKLVVPYLRQILDECYREKVAALGPSVLEGNDEPDPFAIRDVNLTFALSQVFGEEGEGGIAADLRPWHPDIRLTGLGTVARLRDSASLPFVLQGLSDPDSRVRSRALDVLGWVLPAGKPARLACYEHVIPLLVDPSKRTRRHAHRWLTGYSGDKTVPQSYNAWTAWLEGAREKAQVQAYLLQLAQEQGFEDVGEMLTALLIPSTEDYLASLGYESATEFLADMRAEEGDLDPDE